jgi:hypothetical protein
MRILIVTTVFAVSCGTVAVAAEPAAAPGATCPAPVNWRWVAKPDRMQAGIVMSGRSPKAKPGDKASALCEVGPDLRPANCTVIKESPGSGIGDVTLKMSKYYKAASKDAAGQSTLGRKFCLSFTLGATTPAP